MKIDTSPALKGAGLPEHQRNREAAGATAAGHVNGATPPDRYWPQWVRSLYRALRGLSHHSADSRLPAGAHPIFTLSDLGHFPRVRNEAVIRGLCANAYLGENTSLCRVLGRYSMFVDTRDVGFSSHMLLSGFWEMWVTEAIVPRVKPGMRVVDCGANLGYFSLIMADLVGPAGHLDAFEPNPDIASRLSRTLLVNGFLDRSTVHVAALSDSKGETLLHRPDGEPKNAFVLDVPFDREDISSIQVPMLRLDELPDAEAIDLIKIDVEGAEERVWAGMERILEGDRPLTIILEFATCRYVDPGAFIDRITARGFALERIDPFVGVRATTREEIMEHSPVIDQMLVLSR